MSPTFDEKPLFDVCITVRFDGGEGYIEGVIRVLRETTIAGLLSNTLSEYRDAFTRDWPYVIFSKWNERFRRAFAIPASEYAQKYCEDGARYEAFFFGQDAFSNVVDGPPRSLPRKGVVDFGDDEESPPSHSPQEQNSPTLKHQRFWYAVNASSIQPEAERLHIAPKLRAVSPPQVKYEEDDAESNLADSRLGAISNISDRQESATAPGAWNVDIKPEVVEADVCDDNTDLLVQEIVREGAKLEDAYSVHDDGLDDAHAVPTPSVIEPVVAHAIPSHPSGRETRVVRLRSGREVKLVHRHSTEPHRSRYSSAKEQASLFVKKRNRRERLKINKRKWTERKLRQMELLKKHIAGAESQAEAEAEVSAETILKVESAEGNDARCAPEAEAQAEAKAENVSEMDVEAEAEAEAAGCKDPSGHGASPVAAQRIAKTKSRKRTTEQHVSRKRRNAGTGDDADLSKLTEKRKQVLLKLQRKEPVIRRLEADLSDDSRVPPWTFKNGSVNWWRRERAARLQQAKQERDEFLRELKLTEDVLVLYRAARRWYIDHGKTREFFKELRGDGYDTPEKIVRHFWKGSSRVDRHVLFELCVTESAFVFNSQPHKLKSWREAFSTEEAFNDYFNDVFSKKTSGSAPYQLLGYMSVL